MKNKYKFILVGLILLSLIVSIGAASADDLDTIEEGDVSGGVDIAYSNPGVESGELSYDIPEDVKDVQYAGLFVDCYTAGSSNLVYGSEANVTVTSNGESEQIANERLVSTQGSADGTVYRINDHTTKCYADYYMTYNLTDRLQNANGKVTINVTTGSIDGYEFYNKIKLIGLVFAYNDGDTDKVSYWINSGSSWVKGDSGETSKATFKVGTIEDKVLNATLDNFALSSVDGIYTFNGEDLIESESYDEGVYYFKYHKFNVLNDIVNGTNTLVYTPGAGAFSFRNVLSVLTVNREYTPSAKASISSEYSGACFAGTNNVIKLNLTNDGTDKTIYTIDFYVDGVKTSSSQMELDAGADTVTYLVDDLIRPVTADTANGVSTTKVNYTVQILDANGNVLDEKTLTPTLWYNGYLGKDLAYPAETIVSFKNITINGDIIVDTQSTSTYLASASTERTDVWTLNIPEGAEFVNGFIYVAYNWDKTQGTIPALTTTFNNVAVTPVASYRDQSNLGSSGKYGYGLIVYDVTGLLQRGENTFVLVKDEFNKTAIYPSTLVALYNVSESDTIKTVYMYNGADLLMGSSYNFLGRAVESNSVLDISTREDIKDAKLYVFAASAQRGEGNIIANGETYEDVWTGTSNSTDLYVIDLGSYPKDSNAVSFVATGSTILALEQFIVVESVLYNDIYVSPDGTGTGASADDPTTINKALNRTTLLPYTKIHVLDGTYDIASTLNVYTNNTYIFAENPGNAIFNGNDNVRLMRIYATNVTVDGLTFTHGTSSGAGIYVDGDSKESHIVNCIFKDMSHSGAGGAIYVAGPNVFIEKCQFMNLTSTASTGGGAIYFNAVNATVSDCDFKNCNVNRDGGAIRCVKENVLVSNSNFTNCTASAGGAIAWNANNGSVINCIFMDNAANSSYTTYSNGNHTGGAIFWAGTYGLIDNCTFINNKAPLTTNTLGGGAILLGNDGRSTNCTIRNSVFIGNSARNGGAVYWASSTDGRILNCRFESNIADNGSGGAVYWRGDKSHIVESNFTNNHAKENGGAIFITSVVNNYLDIAESNFKNNTADGFNYTIHTSGHLFLDTNKILDANGSDSLYAIYNNGSIISPVIVYAVVNETDPLESNVAYYLVNETADIIVYIVDDNLNTINGPGLTLTIGDETITEFEMDDYAYKASYKLTEWGTYNVNADYARAEDPYIYSGTIVAGEGLHSADVELVSEYNGVCYAGTENVIEVHITNNGAFATNYVVDFYVDGVKVDSTEISLPVGFSNLILVTDETIRPITEATVNGAENDVANYTVIVSDKDTGDVLTEETILPAVLYNGNLGKDFAYPSGNISYFNNITVNGGIIIDSKDTYSAGSTPGRTDIWVLDLDDDATLVNGFIYVAYNWDKTEGNIPEWNCSFNGANITAVASYRDQSNLGQYGKYGYGLVVFDVSNLIQKGENTFSLGKIRDLTAVYPSTLVALYNVTESDVLKTLYMYNGADLLANTNNTAGRTVAANSILNTDFAGIIGANLYVFAAGAQVNEGNLIVNDVTYENIWDGTSQTINEYLVDLGTAPSPSTSVSFVATGSTILALQQFVLVERAVPSVTSKLGSEYSGACFAGTDNVLQLNLTNDGQANTVYTINFYVDGELADTIEVELDSGAQTSVFLVDDLIRPVTANTVNGADNDKVNYTVVISDKISGNVLDEKTLTPTVWYNGNLGKDLAYPPENISSFNNITVNGGIVIDTKDDSTYLSATTTGRTDVWTLDVPEDAKFVNGFVYVAYNWDKTQGTLPVWTTTFNGVAITPVATYRDQSNMGTYGKYGYGLVVYDVSALLQNGENTFVLEKEFNKTAVYPSTIVAMYNVTESDTIKTIYMYNGADLLSNANNFLGRTVASNSVLEIVPIENAISAELTVFAASAQNGEGNLIVNGVTYENIWSGTSNSVNEYVVDLGTAPSESNGVSFIATGSTILALQQFVIVESNAPYSSSDLQKLIDEAEEGATLDLGDKVFEDVSNVVINKDIAITGGTIIGSESAEPIFVITPKSDGGPSEFSLTDSNIIVNNGNVIVKATADNDTNPTSIDTPNINIKNNNIELANDDVVPESVTVLELDSERPILAPTGEIAVTGNTLAAGVDPFDFKVTSVNSDEGTVIPAGPITSERTETQIIYENMTTTAVDVDTDGRVGKYFYITLKDKDGNLLKNKHVQIGFNGNVYDRDTDENGQARLQINLKNAGTYTFAVSYLGDDVYNGSFIVAKIVVNKQKGSLTVPSKTYKASATKTLTATFKSASGKVVSGKKITFTVNGKSYSATTNDKGVATVKVSLNKKGTYSFTAKFAGNTMYAAMNKTAKLTIN